MSARLTLDPETVRVLCKHAMGLGDADLENSSEVSVSLPEDIDDPEGLRLSKDGGSDE